MNANSPASLGERIRQERLRLGWTQARTARDAGVSVRNYARFERLGRTSVGHLLSIVAALGLRVDLTAVPDSGIVPDVRATSVRRRGVRQVRTSPVHSSPVSGSRLPSTPKYQPPTLEETLPASDAAMVGASAKKFRDAIRRLMVVIVRNRLTNWTAAQATRDSMSTNAVPDAEKPGYVGAVLAQLAELTPESIQGFGIPTEDFEPWKRVWRTDEPIHGALD